jgi:nitronate monooxygenase
MSVLDQLTLPITLAPAPGAPDAPAIAAAVSEAGGLGVLTSGYRSTEQFCDELAAARTMTPRPLGAEVAIDDGYVADPERFQAYALRLAAEEDAPGRRLGRPRFDDDALAAKVAALEDEPVAVVSFAAALPAEHVVDELHAAGSEVWLTVTSPAEAHRAVACGADALIVDHARLPMALPAVPLVAAGTIATGGDLAAVLSAGAAAARLVADPDTAARGAPSVVAFIQRITAEARDALHDAQRKLDAAERTRP